MEHLKALLYTYFRRLESAVRDADKRGEGRQTLGSVPGRDPTEDVEAGIDQMAEDLFRDVLNDFQREHPGLREVRVFTEQYPQGWGSDRATLYFFVDPIDGTDEFMRGLDGSVYSVVSVRDARTLFPIAAAALDVYARKIYFVSEGSGATIEYLEDGTIVPAAPQQHKSVSEAGVVGAAYMGRAKYLLPWIRAFDDILSCKKNAAVSWHGKGGSFAYPFIGFGKFSFYAMPDEPVSEVLPGLAFAELLGFPVLVREKDGSWVPFDIRTHGEQERVPFLVAACTQELAEELIGSIRR